MKNHLAHPHIPLISSILTVLVGLGMLAQSLAFTVSAQALGIDIIQPTSGSTWFWGQNYTVQFTTDISVGAVSVTLTKGGAANQNAGWQGAVINPGCSLNPADAIHSCQVTIPSKPAEVTDGIGFFVIIDELGAVGTPKRGIVGISMASSSFGQYGVSIGIDAASDTVGLSENFVQAAIGVNGNSTIPTGEKIRRARFTVHYDQTKITPGTAFTSPWGYTVEYRSDLSNPTTGIMVLDATLTNPNNYPTTSGFMIASWLWVPVALGQAVTEINWTGARVAGDGTDIWLTDVGVTNDPYGDLAADLDPQSFMITVTDTSTTALSGTYYSPKLALTTTAQHFASLDKFTAVYNDNLSANGIASDTKFALGFFDAAGKNICNTVALPNDPANSACGTPTEFGTDGSGYFLVPVDTSGQDFPLTGLNGRSWTSQIASVQVRIFMSTSDFGDTNNASQPWVQSVNIGYQADAIGVIGGVFGQNASIARGTSASYSFVVDPYDTADYTGTATWAITPAQVGNSDVTFTPATGTINFDGSDAAVTVSTPLLAATQNAVLDTPYSFTITVTPSDISKTFTQSVINVTVTGSGTGQFTISINPAAANVAPGGTTAYTVSATRTNGFTGDIQLTDDILTAFGDDVTSVVYQPTNRTITGTGTATISITAASTNTLSTPRNFTVTGRSGGNTATTQGQMTIVSGGNLKNISLELTAPIEGGQDNAQPMFTFRLYDSANQKTFEKTDIKTTADKATVTINSLIVGGVYKGFIRSTRHLWREASGTITVSGTQTNYTMSFTKLLVGDVDPNNVINAIDLPIFTRDWGKTGAGIIPDVDANGAVNALDIVGLFANYFKSGSLLPGN